MKRFFLLLVLSMLPATLPAAPGAHGPNGEHLDAPAGAADLAVDGRPRMEAFSELFELVAHVEPDRVAAMINVYATNAPVDGATVDLESGDATVRAEFDATTGVYSFVDPALAEWLRTPGTHSLAFTIDSPEGFDIVAGALQVSEDAHDHATSRWWWAAAVAVLLAAIGPWLARRRSSRTRHQGGRA